MAFTAEPRSQTFDVATAPTPLGSSWRLRRLVIGGHVLFDPVALARPAMHPDELAMISAIMARSHYMLEFGAGGSTTLALKLGLSKVIAVESDCAWIDRLRSDEAAARALNEGRLQLLHADIGPISALGAPADQGAAEKWPSYAARPWSYVDFDLLDFVLIDGRFRVACALQAILHARRQTVIAIHDFWNRPAYHDVLRFLDETARCNRLGVFRTRASFDRDAAERLLAHASYRPD